MGSSPYRFRLERVRALRERREDEAKMELATAMQQQSRCEQELDEAARRIETARRAQQQTGPSSAADLLARQAYLERVEDAHRSNLEDLRRHDETVAGRREALTEAAQARQALERLKAKRTAEHQREQERVANAALDEIATNGHRRRAAA
jgi:flagellar protein FliJ